MRDYKVETEKRVEFIRKMLEESGASGIIFGNSGGKDSVLVGILCKMACDDTVGLIMPCTSSCNYGDDMADALMISKLFRIEKRMVDLTKTAATLKKALSDATTMTASAEANIAPRLRMTSLYAVAATENRLVAGTGNKSERHMGYFTKWGDGAFDFNPIADLTVTEIYKFLTYLDVPKRIINKAPSACTRLLLIPWSLLLALQDRRKRKPPIPAHTRRAIPLKEPIILPLAGQGRQIPRAFPACPELLPIHYR